METNNDPGNSNFMRDMHPAQYDAPQGPPPATDQPYDAPPPERAIEPPGPETLAPDDALLPSLDRDHLLRLRKALLSNIPGDATHGAAVSLILRALLDAEIAGRPLPEDPDRKSVV